ncbi:hypothetical protein FN846DRAFT_783453 [Sphaerosporella brunnea]|uniref:DNA ligase n=1 Tax=Sphaerosporella brunnea TaxID=1250544 RepID=A0A5J5ENC9_9PEZI|nr:hypothetical protein FN846DRAFT_783453 [Sphaerosporella brunnea]
MGSPAKKRKKNPPGAPYKGKTLDHFFGKKATQKEATAAAVPTLAIKADARADGHGLTDEEYARKLAKEWGEEDQILGAEPENSMAGSKRRRSDSVDIESVAAESNAQYTKISGTPEQKIEVLEASSSTVPVSPSKKQMEISVQAEDEILKTIEALPLDKDPMAFNPGDYRNLGENWPAGKATYGLLTRAFILVDGTRSRITIVDTLVNLLRIMIELDPASLLPAVWLTTNDIGPPYENNELGIGSSIITKAITKTSGITPAALKKIYNKYGDPGDAAFEAKSKQRTLMMRKPTPLTIINVYNTLIKIAATSGKGSQDIKESYVKRLLVEAKGEEIRYLTRTLIQHLRIGAVKTTVLIALARAFSFSRPQNATWECPQIPREKDEQREHFARAEEILKQYFARRPNYNDLIPALLHGGVDALGEACRMAIHIPLKPMLGSITRDLEEMLVKLQDCDFTCEYKYDGQRAQIHCDEDGRVSIFSRHLELMTSKYPDLVALVPKIRGEYVTSFILEGEVVAVDAVTGELKPFQTLAGRERKHVDISNVSVTVCLFAFDLMYINGQELLSKPLRERRNLLRTKFVEIPHAFTWVKYMDATSSDSPTIREFFKSALSSKCEGIMVKALNYIPAPFPATMEEEQNTAKKPNKSNSRRKPLLATYEPDKRLESWLKVKKDYDSSADTLDLIPIGGWHGQGRKAKWWSPILLAVRNPTTGSLEAVCKCMSGFTDKHYAEMKKFYGEDGENTSKTKKGYYDSALTPKVWFEPKEVWEIAFADITLSPTYSAALGLVSQERGLSLRFPRFLRKREDKSIEEASTSEFLAGGPCWFFPLYLVVADNHRFILETRTEWRGKPHGQRDESERRRVGERG